MNYIVEHIGEILITGVVVLFLLNYLMYEVQYKDQKGIFNVLGEVPTDEEWDTNTHTEADELDDALNFVHPKVSVTGHVYETSTSIRFKETFSLYFSDGTELSGADTSGAFHVVLKDVLLNGGSVYLEMTEEQMEEAEEIYNPMYYDPESECVYFFSAGSYTLIVQVKYPNGISAVYKIPIPVETKR